MFLIPSSPDLIFTCPAAAITFSSSKYFGMLSSAFLLISQSASIITMISPVV